ncbi:hypothetical protein JMUB7545_27650 [Staphylococcus aureus]
MASRPVFTEVEAIRRVLYLAKVAGCRLHVCHVSIHCTVEEAVSYTHLTLPTTERV